MAKSSSSPPAAPRPRRLWPLLLFILLAVSAIIATVLLANDRRNLRRLAASAGLPLPSPIATIPPAAGQKPAPKPASLPSGPRWPWLAVTGSAHLAPAPSPASLCRKETEDGQEKPAYAESPERGWECSMLRAGLGEAKSASLFLQARGPLHTPADGARVKFNLSGGPLAGDLADQAIGFIRLATALPPDQHLDEALRKRLTKQADFYYLAGYYGMTFRQEMGDTSRYNLIGTDLALIDGRPQVFGMRDAGKDIGAVKGPRLLTLPAGND